MTEQQQSRWGQQPGGQPGQTGQVGGSGAPAGGQWEWGQLILHLGWALTTPRVFIDGYPVPVRGGVNSFTVTAGVHLVQIENSSPMMLSTGKMSGGYVEVPANGVEHFYWQLPAHWAFPTRVGTTPQRMGGLNLYIAALVATPILMAGLVAFLILFG